MGMFSFITDPINFIFDAVQFIVCLIEYIGKVFKWSGKAIAIGLRILISMPFCFFFYLFHGFWEFVLFMVFDVLVLLVLWPSRALGKVLGYPIPMPVNKKALKKAKASCTAPAIYNAILPKVITGCYSFKSMPTFPKWDLKVPKYGG